MWRQDRGSASVEFIFVSILLVFLAIGVLQTALVLHVRTTVADAAAEGSRWGALADSSTQAAISRTRELIDSAVGSSFSSDITSRVTSWRGHPAVEVTVITTLPVIGLWGKGLPYSVSGHAAREVIG